MDSWAAFYLEREQRWGKGHSDGGRLKLSVERDKAIWLVAGVFREFVSHEDVTSRFKGIFKCKIKIYVQFVLEDILALSWLFCDKINRGAGETSMFHTLLIWWRETLGGQKFPSLRAWESMSVLQQKSWFPSHLSVSFCPISVSSPHLFIPLFFSPHFPFLSTLSLDLGPNLSQNALILR